MTIDRAMMFDFDIRSTAGHAGPRWRKPVTAKARCDLRRRASRRLSGDAIIWPDGTRSSSSPHPSVIIGNKSSVTVGPGVFVGQGKGVVPL